MSLPEGHYATADGLRVHFHSLGDGPAVVFLHGSGPGASGYSNFIGNAEVLAAAGFRCVLVDNLGYGRSDKPELDRHFFEFAANASSSMCVFSSWLWTIAPPLWS